MGVPAQLTEQNVTLLSGADRHTRYYGLTWCIPDPDLTSVALQNC